MDISPNSNQNSQQNRSRHNEGTAAAPMTAMMKSGAMVKAYLALLSLAAVIFIIGGSIALTKMSQGAGGTVKGGQYQALFLTNGQVYFGKLSKTDGQWIKLTDIYYLQVQQQVQPSDKTKTDSPQVSLAKLGNELHGPEDAMYVDRSQVLFWENLKNDGKVVSAIKDFQKNGNK